MTDHPLHTDWSLDATAARRDRYYAASLSRFHWMIEESRVSVFAQELKTAMPVSSKRLKTQWSRVLKDKG